MKLLSLACVVFATCAFAPSETYPFAPPAHYREIWAEAEACTGVQGDFDKVLWYEEPGNSFPTPTGAAIGYWSGHTITIAHDWRTTDWVVKHEEIHELTRFTHDGTPSEPGPRDIQVWGKQCHAMWGFQPIDSTYRP